ncbi:hypothetical protein [Halomonas faecis]|uniref:hypothetical protein n=1 Tax=Halomonas faecis TaxID=1562110 RepID=UPI0013D02E64|nr:hypothetical protein [Halomonas faecis]
MPFARLLGLPLAALLLFAAWPADLALASSEPTPFSARYRLQVSGWPDVTIEHRLAQEGHYWLSEMQASIAMASGEERSRFMVDDTGVQSLHYSSGYSLLGIGDRYSLASDTLRELPDRQTALFLLSQRAHGDQCAATCRLTYQDHRGDRERLRFRVLPRQHLSVPAGDFEALTIEATNPDEPGRRLMLRFHPELPGLLLAADYHRDGERRSRLTLTSLEHSSP